MKKITECLISIVGTDDVVPGHHWPQAELMRFHVV